MQKRYKRLRKRVLRRFSNSQAGQSIILLAIGFVALGAFVGLVTDVSIMFVRYATLRRAVDEAAVAAAGQIREGTNYGNVAIAARQYISLHGLEPHRVWVETCETEVAEWRSLPGNSEALKPTFAPGEDPDFPDGLTVVQLMETDPDFETELCSSTNPRKLVKVTAQIESQTSFLGLIGIDDFILTAAATSETAALDIALVLDTSYSMSVNTNLNDYTRWGLLPQAHTSYFTEVGGELVVQNTGRGPGNRLVPFNCQYQNLRNGYNYESNPSGTRPPTNYDWGGCCNDPGNGNGIWFNSATGEWEIYRDTNGDGEFNLADGDIAGIPSSQQDGLYTDLVCEPFKQVKDAARGFIGRLDFIRGDRVALVTFDRTAKIIFANQDPRTITIEQSQTLPPMINNGPMAIETLNRYVGVYEVRLGPGDTANPSNANCIASFYAIEGVRNFTFGRVETDPINPTKPLSNDTFHPFNLRPYSYEHMAQCTTTNVGDGIRYANSALTAATTIRRDAVWVAIILSDGAANASLNVGEGPYKAVEYAVFADDFDIDDSGTYDVFQEVGYPEFGFCPWYTFCYYRPPSDILFYDSFSGTRRTDAMWFDFPIATDPRYPPFDPAQFWLQNWNVGIIDQTETFQGWSGMQAGVQDWLNSSAGDPARAQGFSQVDFSLPFPSYAECYESYQRNGIANPANHPNTQFNNYNRHYDRNNCNDNNPKTRHFCLVWSTSREAIDRNFIPENLTNTECDRTGRYDADDYARDMADWAGLIEVYRDDDIIVSGNFIAMFAIGFGPMSPFDPIGPTGALNTTAVPLLHYIADAGDNGVIDNNLQQDWRDNGILDEGFNASPEDYSAKPEVYGLPDVCEGKEENYTEQCGQYFYASSLQDLDRVFEAIASRLFTRIAR